MEAIVLAGGFGTRLRSVVSDVPKPMAPVAGRPFLEYVLDYLENQGVEHVVLSTGYMHEVIERHFANQYKGMSVDYAVETTPLGTGGGMLNATTKCRNDNMIVVNGDTLFRADLASLQKFHNRHCSGLTMIMRHVDDTSRYGSVTTDTHGRIVGFTEKNNTHGHGTINGGIYMINRIVFDGFTPGDTFSFERDILQKQYTSEPMYAYAADDFFIDIGIPEDYQRFVELNSPRD